MFKWGSSPSEVRGTVTTLVAFSLASCGVTPNRLTCSSTRVSMASCIFCDGTGSILGLNKGSSKGSGTSSSSIGAGAPLCFL